MTPGNLMYLQNLETYGYLKTNNFNKVVGRFWVENHFSLVS